eukprot:m.342420 g.342420  ORF g.342420 m.342420 type:complete len:1519 (+) comp16122_c0_seq4:630-5186(+)
MHVLGAQRQHSALCHCRQCVFVSVAGVVLLSISLLPNVVQSQSVLEPLPSSACTGALQEACTSSPALVSQCRWTELVGCVPLAAVSAVKSYPCSLVFTSDEIDSCVRVGCQPPSDPNSTVCTDPASKTTRSSNVLALSFSSFDGITLELVSTMRSALFPSLHQCAFNTQPPQPGTPTSVTKRPTVPPTYTRSLLVHQWCSIHLVPSQETTSDPSESGFTLDSTFTLGVWAQGKLPIQLDPPSLVTPVPNFLQGQHRWLLPPRAGLIPSDSFSSIAISIGSNGIAVYQVLQNGTAYCALSFAGVSGYQPMLFAVYAGKLTFSYAGLVVLKANLLPDSIPLLHVSSIGFSQTNSSFEGNINHFHLTNQPGTQAMLYWYSRSLWDAHWCHATFDSDSTIPPSSVLPPPPPTRVITTDYPVRLAAPTLYDTNGASCRNNIRYAGVVHDWMKFDVNETTGVTTAAESTWPEVAVTTARHTTLHITVTGPLPDPAQDQGEAGQVNEYTPVCSAMARLVVRVVPPLALSVRANTSRIVPWQQLYSKSILSLIDVSGGSGPCTQMNVSGLPEGLTFLQSELLLDGTATSSGKSRVSVCCTDSTLHEYTKCVNLTLVVKPTPKFSLGIHNVTAGHPMTIPLLSEILLYDDEPSIVWNPELPHDDFTTTKTTATFVFNAHRKASYNGTVLVRSGLAPSLLAHVELRAYSALQATLIRRPQPSRSFKSADDHKHAETEKYKYKDTGYAQDTNIGTTSPPPALTSRTRFGDSPSTTPSSSTASSVAALGTIDAGSGFRMTLEIAIQGGQPPYDISFSLPQGVAATDVLDQRTYLLSGDVEVAGMHELTVTIRDTNDAFVTLNIGCLEVIAAETEPSSRYHVTAPVGVFGFVVLVALGVFVVVSLCKKHKNDPSQGEDVEGYADGDEEALQLHRLPDDHGPLYRRLLDQYSQINRDAPQLLDETLLKQPASLDGDASRGEIVTAISYLYRPAMHFEVSVLCKAIQCEAQSDCQNFSLLINELAIMQRLQPHENVAHLYGIAIDSRRQIATLTLEFNNDFTLEQHLRSSNTSPMTILRPLCDIACALSFLQSKQIVHRFVSPENILIQRSTNCAKLESFQWAALSDQNVAGLSPPLGRWSSPETCQDDVTPASAQDIWAFGVLMWDCLCELRFNPKTKEPSLDQAKKEYWQAVGNNVYHQVSNSAPCERLRQLLNGCFAKSPTQRLTAAAIQQMVKDLQTEARLSSTVFNPHDFERSLTEAWHAVAPPLPPRPSTSRQAVPTPDYQQHQSSGTPYLPLDGSTAGQYQNPPRPATHEMNPAFVGSQAGQAHSLSGTGQALRVSGPGQAHYQQLQQLQPPLTWVQSQLSPNQFIQPPRQTIRSISEPILISHIQQPGVQYSNLVGRFPDRRAYVNAPAQQQIPPQTSVRTDDVNPVRPVVPINANTVVQPAALAPFALGSNQRHQQMQPQQQRENGADHAQQQGVAVPLGAEGAAGAEALMFEAQDGMNDAGGNARNARRQLEGADSFGGSSVV